VVWELQQRRRYHRIWAEGRVEIFVPRLGTTVPAALQDISLGGLSVQPLAAAPVEENEKVVIRAPGFNGRPFSLQASLVRNSLRKGKREWGCEFTIPDVSAFAEIVGFVYGDSRRWVRFWEQRKYQQVRISRGFLHLFRIGWKGAFRNFKGVLVPQWKKWVDSTRALSGKAARPFRRKSYAPFLPGF
jgi:hypothetical protein